MTTLTRSDLSMTARDIAIFLISLVNAKTSNLQDCYWETAPRDQLSTLVNVLSNPNDQERNEIRSILQQSGAKKILDAGCGPATELTSYKTHGLNVEYLGMDRSVYMLDIAKDRHPKAKFIKGDITQVPFRDNTFDAVLLKHVLEHLPNYRQAVIEGVRTSKGIIVIDFFHKLIPGNLDIYLKDFRGFFNNWYSKSKFEEYLSTLPISHYEKTVTKGAAKQTAQIYVLHKK